MAVIANKRSMMTLYSSVSDIYSHRVRIALAEKGVAVEVVALASHQKSEDLLELNPYNSVPTLVDRDLVLYDANIIMEYLDERFPHPPLMPVYPVARARARLMIYRIDREWSRMINVLETSHKAQELETARKELRSYLLQLAPVFNNAPFFLSEEFSLIDCCLAPILWRLSSWRIAFTGSDAKPILRYADRLFQRDAFLASLTETELELRKLPESLETA